MQLREWYGSIPKEPLGALQWQWIGMFLVGGSRSAVRWWYEIAWLVRESAGERGSVVGVRFAPPLERLW